MTDTDERFETIIEKLRANYYKITPQRLAIAEILAKSTAHPSVEDIYEQLGKDYPSMSLATVYRNVMLMKSLGEILELGFPDGSNRYDGKKPYPHPHIICIQCGKIIEPHLTTLQEMTKEVIQKTNFTILTHQLDFFGKCGDCKSENPARSQK